MMRISEDSRLVDQRVMESIVRLRSIEELQKRERQPVITPVVTISRQLGAGGSEVAHKLAQMLGEPWQVWDQQIIDGIAKRADVHRQMIEALDEHVRGEIEAVVTALLGVGGIETPGYRKHLAEILLTIERSGFAIILGRGANFVLPKALNVRLRATMPVRIKRVMEQMNLTREQAEKKIHESDRERENFIRQTFGRDIDEDGAYDLVIYTDKLTPDGLARIIHTAVLVRYPELEKPSSVYALVRKR